MNYRFALKDLSGRLVSPSAILVPNSYTWAAIGGPDKASVSVRGTREDILQLADFMAYEIQIMDASNNQPYWWGQIYDIEMRFGQSTVNVSLGAMYNRIKVTYRDTLSGAGSQETAWGQDNDSVNYYGKKERIYSGSDMTADEALQRRDVLIGMTKYPQAINKTGQSEGGSYSALLTCKGWFNAISWMYYTQPAGLEELTVTGDGTQNFGDGTTYQAAQSFVTSNTRTWSAYSTGAKLRKFGAPTDDVYMDLCSDNAGEPGTVLATATIDDAEFSEQYKWIYAELGSNPTLQPNTKYWLKLRRAGSQDGTNYYSLDVSEGDYRTDGICRLYNGSVWSDRSPAADFPFKVAGVLATSEQIKDIASADQFLTGVTVETDTTVYGNPYRDGKADAQFYLRELLRTGTQDGRRFLCRVDIDKHLHVWQEPLPTSAPAYVVSEDGRWWDQAKQELSKAKCPVGVWYKIKETPIVALGEHINDPGTYFIESSTYNVDKDTLETEPRLSTGAFDIIQIE